MSPHAFTCAMRQQAPHAWGAALTCPVRWAAGCGKTTWAAQHVKAHPDKRYVTLGTSAILEQMRARPALRALAQPSCACGLKQAPACLHVHYLRWHVLLNRR